MSKTHMRFLFKLLPKRRSAQFSLGTLFLLTTVTGVVLRVVVVPAEDRRRAVAAVKALRGEVSYAVPSGSRAWTFPIGFLKSYLPADYLTDVYEINLSASKISDAELTKLRPLTRLRRLNLYRTRVAGAGLTALEGFRDLEWLNLNRTQTADDGLANLRCLDGLQVLYLDGTRVTDAGMKHLCKLPALRELWLNDTQVGDEGLDQLRHLATLQLVMLGGTSVSDDAIARLHCSLPGCQITRNCSSSE